MLLVANFFRPLSLALLISLLSLSEAKSWGFYAHEKIHQHAVFYQPPELYALFKAHLDEIVENSVAADERRFVDDSEGHRHYIDIDVYGKYPFEELPRDWEDAKAKFGEDSLKEYGTAPWAIENFFEDLVQAFKDKDRSQIIRIAADLGHYVSDINSPLHTTENYNGQFTGQEGIHSLWESRLPELFADEYDLLIEDPYYVKDPLDRAFDIVLEAHPSVDSLLRIEREVRNSFPGDALYVYEERGQQRRRMRSQAFCRAYSDAMDGMVERFFRKSIHDVASFWYSAWVKAGQPEFSADPEEFRKTLEIEPTNEYINTSPEDFEGRPDK